MATVDEADGVEYEYPAVYEDSHVVVRDHLNEDDEDERVAVYVGTNPMETTPTITDARRLRDALNEYLDDGNHQSAAFPATDAETSLTVEVDADVSAAREAIESLQTDVDALTADLNGAAEHVEELDFTTVDHAERGSANPSSSTTTADYGLPAPSPSDVQARLDGETDSHTTDVEMVPAAPLYELAELWSSVSVHDPMGDKRAGGYRQGRKEAGDWLKDELDELTGDDAEETSATNTPSVTTSDDDE